MKDLQLTKLEHDVRVLRLVLLAVVETHPDPEALMQRLKLKVEQAMATGLASARMPEQSLDQLPQDLQKWLDSAGKAL